MHLDGEELRSLIGYSLNGTITERQLSRLVQMARGICQAHFLHMRPAAVHAAMRQGWTLSELAYECLSEAFARYDNKHVPFLQKLTDALNTPLQSVPADELVRIFRSFLTRIADTQLAHLYAQSDSVGAKIYRNIRVAILKRATCFALVSDFRGLVLYPVQHDPLDECEPFPFDLLMKQFLDCARSSHNIPELVQIIHSIVTEQTVYRRSVPMSEIAALCKMVYVSPLEIEKLDEHLLDVELTEQEIQQIRTQVERTLKEKIFATYLVKGKLDRRQSEALFYALSDFMQDWTGDGTTKSLFDYLSRYANMSKTEYEETYRMKIEYMLTIAREEFGARLMKEL